jgi:hypothetical protein
MVALRDHLRSYQYGTMRTPKMSERLAERTWPRSRVGIEPDPFELGYVSLQLLLEALGTGPDVCELGGAATRARVRHLLAVTTVMAMEASVTVQGQGDIAVRAPSRQAAGTAVDRRSRATPVEQQDRLSPPFRDPA